MVELDSLILSASGVSVEYNSSNRPGGKVIDFSGDDVYRLDTGNGVLAINYDSKVLRASVDDARLQIGSYVFISGGLAFSKGPSRQVNLTSGIATVSTIDVGAEDLTMFFGVDGPYWNDLNNNHHVDTGETNPNAVGLAITNANLAMTLMKTTTSAKYLALHATADQVGFVGIEAFQLGASNVAVDLNLALGAGATNTTPVVNFASTFATDERQALFDVFAGDDGEISQGELDAAIGTGHEITAPLKTAQELIALLDELSVVEVTGQLTHTFSVANLGAVLAADKDGNQYFGLVERQALFDVFAGDDGEISQEELDAAIGPGHEITDPLTTAQELIDLLNHGGAPPDAILSLDEVLGQLKDTFMNATASGQSQTNLQRINSADTDGDGKFDPIGYEVKTGSGSLYLSSDHRQIHASADNVLINVAQFVYVQGNVALDIGSRETVTINTGIPASLGSQASAVVDTINAALKGLSDGLDGLKEDVRNAIHDAIAVSLRGALDALLNDVINSIVDYLKTQLGDFVGTVGDFSETQLNAAVTAVRGLVNESLNAVVASLSVDALLDELINPIVDPIIELLPDLLKGPVRGLLNSCSTRSGKSQRRVRRGTPGGAGQRRGPDYGLGVGSDRRGAPGSRRKRNGRYRRGGS